MEGARFKKCADNRDIDSGPFSRNARHRGALQGDYSEQQIDIQGYGRWED